MGSLLKVRTVRHLDAAGKQVPKGTPGARKVVEKSAKWYGQYVGADGKRKRVPLATDKAAARSMLARLEREAMLGRAGVVDPYAEHRRAPLADHVADYEVCKRNQGLAPRTITIAMQRLRAVLAGCQARGLDDVRPERVERFLATLADRKAAPATRNTYLIAVRSFVRWCVRTHRIGEDALACLAPARIAGDIRRRRRALSEEELGRLLRAARERPVTGAMVVNKGPHRGEYVAVLSPAYRAELERIGLRRALIYKTLVLTGLRRGELAALEVRHLQLDGPRPCLVLPAKSTKNRQGADIPIRADLVNDLRSWIVDNGLAGSDRVFKVSRDLNKFLQSDLGWAGIPRRDEQGRSVDVHSLRHCTGTFLGRGKVTPRVAQGFMRHADIKLTMQTYSDPRLLDEAEALRALPDLPLDKGQPEPDERPGRGTIGSARQRKISIS